MDKTLEMRCKIEAVFEHYAEQSEYYSGANVAQRFVMKDRFYWLTMELLGSSTNGIRRGASLLRLFLEYLQPPGLVLLAMYVQMH